MITRDQIKVGTVMSIGPVTYEVMFVKGYNVGLKNLRDGMLYPEYNMQDQFLNVWNIVSAPLQIDDIILNETYTDGQFQYNVRWKNQKIVLAYRDTEPFIYHEDDIASWKKYVKPSKPVVATVTFFRNKKHGTLGCVLGDTSKQHGFAEYCEVLRVDKIEYKE